MPSLPRLIGMVHLRALPGSPGYGGSMDEVVEAAVADATTLTDAGFPALMVENFGDAPFFPDSVPPMTVAALTRVTTELTMAVDVPVGVNVLRNDALTAVAVAAATGAAMVRVNVLSGQMHTDQGPITGRAAEVARLRASVAPEVAILADVFVKHAVPPSGLTLEQAAADTWERAGADALIVSGSGTGTAADPGDARRVATAAPDAPVLIGSGVTADSLPDLATVAYGVIVGTAVKEQGRVDRPVDARRAAELLAAARRAGMVA